MLFLLAFYFLSNWTYLFFYQEFCLQSYKFTIVFFSMYTLKQLINVLINRFKTHKSALSPRLSCFVTSVVFPDPLCIWQMLGFEWQLVAMVTEMGPVERSPVALVVQAAAWFAVAVLGGVLWVVISAARVYVLVRRHVGWRWVVLCVKWEIIWCLDSAALFILPSQLQNPRRNARTHANICKGQLDVVFKVRLLGLSCWQQLRCLDAIHTITAHSVRQRRPFLAPQTAITTLKSIPHLVIIQLRPGDGELTETLPSRFILSKSVRVMSFVAGAESFVKLAETCARSHVWV